MYRKRYSYDRLIKRYDKIMYRKFQDRLIKQYDEVMYRKRYDYERLIK